MVHQFFKDNRPHNGLTYKQYLEILKNKIDLTKTSVLRGESIRKFEIIKLNYQRMLRINKTYTLDSNLCGKVQEIVQPQLWMLITEDWCGDSAQIIPYIAKISECNPKIELRIISRDLNQDIINLYLTNGKTRGIPKLVSFDLDGNELFQWGPRPKEAQDLVNKAITDGKPKEHFLSELHLWYGKNKGKNLEMELMTILKNSFSYCS